MRSLTLGEKKGEDATLGETCLKIVRGVTQIESEILMTGLLACIQDNARMRFNIQYFHMAKLYGKEYSVWNLLKVCARSLFILHLIVQTSGI